MLYPITTRAGEMSFRNRVGVVVPRGAGTAESATSGETRLRHEMSRVSGNAY